MSNDRIIAIVITSTITSTTLSENPFGNDFVIYY